MPVRRPFLDAEPTGQRCGWSGVGDEIADGEVGRAADHLTLAAVVRERDPSDRFPVFRELLDLEHAGNDDADDVGTDLFDVFDLEPGTRQPTGDVTAVDDREV